ncbi:hypothetical protein LINGRAHAP2_LOCUS32014 [Linum grandiflorum]
MNLRHGHAQRLPMLASSIEVKHLNCIN